jgi:hypothetical protein
VPEEVRKPFVTPSSKQFASRGADDKVVVVNPAQSA